MRKLLALLSIAWALVACCTSLHAAIDTLAYYRLGEADPGAFPSNIGQNPTFDSGLNHLNLARFGTPHYSPDVGALGSTVSMSFDPATLDAYYRDPIAAPSDNLGIQGWVKSSGQGSGSGTGVIAFNGFSGTSGFGLVRVEGGTPFGGLAPVYEGLLGGTVVGFVAVPDERWVHLALVRDSGTTTFYVNGQAAGSSSVALSPPTQAFSIGASYCAQCAAPIPTSDYLKGLVDEVRVFDFQPGAFDPARDLFFQAVPEPSVAATLLIGPLLLLRRRRCDMAWGLSRRRSFAYGSA